MQLTPAYRAKLHPKFLAWYLQTFTSSRHGYVHWPVGDCHQNFVEYHQVVAMLPDDSAARVYRNADIGQDTYRHTSGRNTNAWATAVDGFGDATTTDLGTQVCKPAQLRLLIQTLAQDCIALYVPVGNLLSHAEAADMRDCADRDDPNNPGAPPYGPTTTCERWDFHVRIHPRLLTLRPAFDGTPYAEDRGWLYFMDWVRGETALLIQELKKGQWQ